MAVCKSYPQATMLHDARQRYVRGIDVKLALHSLKIWGDLAEEVKGFFVCKIAQTDDLTDFTRRKQLAELSTESVNVRVSDREGALATRCDWLLTFAGISYRTC